MLACGEFSSGRAQDSARAGRWLVPPWIAPAFFLCAVILIVWAGFLILTLPRNYTANHWHVAWGGFDVGLGVALVATAVAVVRRSPYAEVAAAVSGTLLVCDAWFDLLTSRTTSGLVQAALEAALSSCPWPRSASGRPSTSRARSRSRARSYERRASRSRTTVFCRPRTRAVLNGNTTISGDDEVDTSPMMLRRPARSLWVFLGLVVAVGTLFGHVLEGAAFAIFFLFISSIDAKPAFKAQFDAPGSQDSGRGAGRFLSWRRVPPQSPHDQRRMPNLDDY